MNETDGIPDHLMTEHSPLPWVAQEYDAAENGIGIISLRSDDGIPYESPTNGLVAWVTLHPTEMNCGDSSRAEANAAFIVRAVNNHDVLVKALKLQEAAERAHMKCDECDPEDAPETCGKCFPLYDDARIARRAALALVGEQGLNQ